MAKLVVFVQSSELDSIHLDETKTYVIGRAAEADIQIRDATFSRQHLRLFFENTWQIECVSKFAEIQAASGSTKHLVLDETMNFMVGTYRFHFLTEESNKTKSPMSFEVEQDYLEDAEAKENEHFIEDDDTAVNFQLAQPYLTITYSNQSVENLKLDGDEWVLGRSDEAQIILKDGKASRKHCQIVKNQNQFFAIDLGSANGTYLNKKRMKANKIAPLNSGDVIQIGSTQLVFELIDEAFQSKLMNVPQQVLQANLPAPQVPSPFAGALQVKGNSPLAQQGAIKIFAPNQNAAKKKKFVAIFAALLLCMIFLLKDEGNKKVTSKNLASKVETRSPFELLSKDNQDLVIRFYDQAYRLYIQGNYELALNETKKIHRLLPETGYLDLAVEKDSKELEKLIQAAIDLNRQKDIIQQRQEQQRRLIEEVNRMVNRCDRLARPGTSVQTAQACLSQALELDPENKAAAAIIARLEAEEDQRRAIAAQKAYVAGQVDRGEDLYQKALGLEKKDQILDAISAYDRHIASNYPDPNNLKEKSKQRRQQLSLDLRKRIEVLMKEASTDFESKNYRGSIGKLTSALKLDPSVREAKDLLQTVSNELNKNMKTLYSDSVLEESLGNIESAKSLWKKIIDTDVPSGDYYRKAKSKLKKYGN